jgi:hypothetical protein
MAVSVSVASRRERLYYVGMAVVIATIAFAGFAPSYYLRWHYDSPPLMPLLHLHGLVFTSWLVLLVVQTSLVAAGRVDLHRRLGVAGAVLAGLMVVVGTVTAVIRAGQGAAPPGVSPLAFLAVPLGDIVVFASLVASALHFRRRPDVHKRLMLLATISLMAAPIARLPFVLQGGPPAFFGLADLLIVACVAYDIISRGRLHRATVFGGLVIVLSQPLRLMLSGTGAWLRFAEWLTR